ncbi:MAG: hypothetical protein S4CHLAM20_04120 [Chlamydiia bacterium]|nr:hypothetical protein [Chlamydiia bacterium]
MSKNTKKYRIVTLSVSGKGNNIYRGKEVVEGYKLNNLESLLKEGAVVLDGEKKKEKSLDEMNVKELTAFYAEKNPSADDLKSFDALKKDEKVSFLKSL